MKHVKLNNKELGYFNVGNYLPVTLKDGDCVEVDGATITVTCAGNFVLSEDEFCPVLIFHNGSEKSQFFYPNNRASEKDVDNFLKNNSDLMDDLAKMEQEEKDRLESTDLYRIAARVKNLARSWDASLTPAGESLCNAYIMVLKDLYDFAEKLYEPKRTELKNLLLSKEDLPRKVIDLNKPKKKGNL